MSNFLNDIASNKITIEEALQRLLIIANKTENNDLSKWCINELNGYKDYNDLPAYRKFKNRNIFYSGINGNLQINNAPIGPGFLSEDTLSKIENMGIFDNIAKIEECKDSKEQIYKNLTALAGEVSENTFDGYFSVQCTSIRQIISSSCYSQIYSNVKTRIINLLCTYESEKIDIDKLDINTKQLINVKKKNIDIYNSIVEDGKLLTIVPKENKLVWQIIVPIITAILSGVVVYLITVFW